ncbi:MAG: hypothetical protein AVDCRST_MAG77-3552 [uncultured Chloroflexi bacterium]|uniref:Uncharacterized protein n=1 Tax=uncultured Chloroflexota bacterium TaxID=166587 RepID=A0A6J4JCJ4_9CHLR|nr:MAG: hypothetical protein AVDCRST_MAG77-3552 [uncultured Chloroflexota bacterium]
MFTAIRFLRAAAGEFFYDLPRMVLLNLIWFVATIPTLYIAFVWYRLTIEGEGGRPALHVWPIPLMALTFALSGPATAGVYYVTNRLANGELLEVPGVFAGFRRFFWRGWGLALIDATVLGLLVLNVVFYWYLDRPGVQLLSVIFGSLIGMWYAVQGYLFSLLVEMDQSLRLVLRNALFIAVDNLGLTLGVMVVNAVFLFFAGTAWPVALPFVIMALSSSVHNKTVVEAVARYREQGRVFTDQPTG